MYLPTKFGADMSNCCRFIAINVFKKRRPAAILDFIRSEISRHFWFWDTDFSLRARYCGNMCNSDCSPAVIVIFQNGGRRHFGCCLNWNVTSA